MTPETPNVGSLVIVGLVLLFGVVLAARIIAGIRETGRRTRAFVDEAFAARDLPPATPVVLPFRPAAGMPHAVWLDLEVVARGEARFDLWLWVRVGPNVLVEATYPVFFDDEGDAHGLPDGTSLNNVFASVLGKRTIATTLRLFYFVAPPAEPMSGAAPAEVRARVVIGASELSFTRSRLLVTVPDMPPVR